MILGLSVFAVRIYPHLIAAFLSSPIGTFKYLIIWPSATFPKYLTVYNSLNFLLDIGQWIKQTLSFKSIENIFS